MLSSPPPAADAPCLSEQTVLELVAGALPPAQAAVANAHLETCESCRSWVAMVARVEAEPPTVTQNNRAAPEVLLEPGRVLGQYEIQQRVGSGGMSHVYSALDRQLGRTVALKVLHADLAADAGTRSRLSTEAQAMARLSHPNVVTVFEAKELDGVLYLAMEFVEGVTLSRWLRDSRRSLRDILHAFSEAGHGLSAAHAAGIVHRDFKPHNVLMGTDGRVRVTDFGIARVQQSAPSKGVTQVGQFVGTPAYSSPEQMAGLTVDARSDQFSFCVALYEALFERRPFAGSSLTEVSQSIRESDVQFTHASVPVSSGLQRVLRRGLSRAPEARFASMNELLAGLAQAQSTSRAAVWVGAATALAATLAFVVVRALATVPAIEAPALAVTTPAPVAVPAVLAAQAAPPHDDPPAPAAPVAARVVQHPHPAVKKPAASAARLTANDGPPDNGRVTLVPSGLGFAEVFIDDEKSPRGRVPRQAPFDLTPGPHRIRLQRGGDVLDDQQVNVTAAGAQTLSVNVERR